MGRGQAVIVPLWGRFHQLIVVRREALRHRELLAIGINYTTLLLLNLVVAFGPDEFICVVVLASTRPSSSSWVLHDLARQTSITGFGNLVHLVAIQSADLLPDSLGLFR